jgi:hypothetical protein
MGTRQRTSAHLRLFRLAIATALLAGATAAAPPGTSAAVSVYFRLPYVGGQGWRVNQAWDYAADECGNPGQWSHCSDSPRNRYAYDFGPPADPGKNLPVVAAAAGTVKEVVKPNQGQTSCGGSANYVIILHSDGTYSEYWHLSDVYAVDETEVLQGQILGTVGCTGNATGPHIHFARLTKTNGVYKSIKTNFQDAPSASGTLTNPTPLTVGNYYNADNPCSDDTTKPLGDLMAVPYAKFCARYYRDRRLDTRTAIPEKRYWSAMSRLDTTISFYWGTPGFPETTSDPQTDYSKFKPYFSELPEFGAIWTGRFYMTSGTYRFYLNSSDGIELFVDDMSTPKFSSWVDRSTPGSWQPTMSIATGYHIVRIKYFHAGTDPARVVVGWQNCNLGPC